MTTKTCTVCTIEKIITDFYKHSKMPDGHLNQCKECKKLAQIKTRNDNIEYYRNYDRNRPNKQERAKAVNEYRKTDQGKQTAKITQDNYRNNHPLKYIANNKINNSIKSGKLIRPTECSSCNITCVPHGHHSDYSKPLDVIWFCEPCHQEWHRHNTPLYNE